MGKITNRRKILAIIIVSLLFLPVSNCAIREPEKPDKPISQIQVGESWHTIDSDQKMRRYLLYIPASYDGNTPAPLVLNFHGSGSSGDNLSITHIQEYHLKGGCYAKRA